MLTSNILRIRDETAMGQVIYEFDLLLSKPQVSVKEIISERVKLEVENYRNKKKSKGYSLFEVDKVEQILNKYDLKTTSKLDIEKQVAIALRAFDSNEFFIIIDNTQVDSLEQRVDITDNLQVSFLKLVPIMGG